MASIQQALPMNRSPVFALALLDIWLVGNLTASDADGYTAEDYFEQLHGLGYEEVVDLADSSELLAFRDYSPRVRRAATPPPPSSSRSGSDRFGWGNTIDQFDPSPTGWRPHWRAGAV